MTDYRILDQLAQAAKARHLSGEAIAERAILSPAAVQQLLYWRTGKLPNLRTVQKVAAVLGYEVTLKPKDP